MHWLLPAAPLGKFTWRMLATVLAAQAVVIFFGALVARGIAGVEEGAEHASRTLLVGSGLAVLSIIAAGLVRRGPVGVVLGWLVQIACVGSGFVVGSMFVVGAIFLALWVYCLREGHRVDTSVGSSA